MSLKSSFQMKARHYPFMVSLLGFLLKDLYIEGLNIEELYGGVQIIYLARSLSKVLQMQTVDRFIMLGENPGEA